MIDKFVKGGRTLQRLSIEIDIKAKYFKIDMLVNVAMKSTQGSSGRPHRLVYA